MKNILHLVLALFAFGLCGSAAEAHAQTTEPKRYSFGEVGQFSVTAERLFGFAVAEETTVNALVARDDFQNQVTETSTELNLLGSRFKGSAASFTAPRIGLDYFVIKGLSVGGAVAYYSFEHGSAPARYPGDERANEKHYGFLLAPRVGYCHMFGELFGIWPRAGVSYAYSTVTRTMLYQTAPQETTARLLALTVEALLVINPVPHAAITFGPTLDKVLSGSAETTERDVNAPADIDLAGHSIGAQAGLLLYF